MALSLRFAGVSFLLALLTGCASSPSGQLAVADAPQSDVVCFFEAPTGTNRKIRRCMSKEDYNKASETAQRTASDIKTTPPPLQ